jgi:hypothetical protein
MKKITRASIALLTMGLAGACSLQAQSYFSGFDFNQATLTTATFGPNATYADPNAVWDGIGAAYINANCGALKGIDLTIPVVSGLFDQPSLGMTFRFRKTESRSDFFVRGGTSFYQEGGVLLVNYRTSDGAAGFLDYGPFATGYSLPADGNYHEYAFVYHKGNGLAEVKVDGAVVWSNDGPDNRPLYWVGAPDIKVGTVMDGNCPGAGTLDHANFYNPDGPLNIEFIAFDAYDSDGNVILEWETSYKEGGFTCTVQRSEDGFHFSPLAEVEYAGDLRFDYTDVRPGNGQWYYRIQQVDPSGEVANSKIVEVYMDKIANFGILVWPNPSQGLLNMTLPNNAKTGEVAVYDLLGKVVFQQALTGSTASLELRSLPHGLYNIQCKAGNERFTQLVLLE